jgi:predicted CoA-binding protein
MDDLDERIAKFLTVPAFAVAGASNDRNKYGCKVYLCYLQNNLRVFAINPNTSTVFGKPAYAGIGSLPERVESVSIITPPAVTERIVDNAIAHGVTSLWIQPGAESALAIEKAMQAGINVISGGPCILVVLNYRETIIT